MPRGTKLYLAAATLIAMMVGLAGCNLDGTLHKVAGADNEARAAQYVDLLRTHEFNPIIRDLDSSIHNVDVEAEFNRMSEIFPEGNPVSVKLVGAKLFRGRDEDDSSLTYEYEFPSRWIIVELTTRATDQATTISSFHVEKLSQSLESSSAFRLYGRTGPEYVTLFFALSSAGLSAYAFITCIRQKDLSRKWIWLLVTLVGVGRFAINWNTGGTSLQLLWLSLIPAGATANAYTPWVIYVSLPIGAIAFLVRNEERVRGGSDSPAEDHPA